MAIRSCRREGGDTEVVRIKDNIVAVIIATILSQVLQCFMYMERWQQICIYMLIFLCIKEVLKPGNS
ncbi:hypothetical protein AALD22_24030 [Lachnospiraceae bacterium 56-18]|jgi:ribose/xylose/arabinose/galactoside ABC-type transport system permease subunit